ncbi:saccharopine dehydrogenase NADP-binding domain-containing protein [Bradyrhizobium sp. Arg237L]|uniref:saccharopine dehydrogenase NADP-binding domain-containing protein n=1 Tax=Bradyrhizobium sp. Arg237L TaxID=3003352 RepID=UPI00249EACA4|nr:saccharopine dehydrogenase NADP-binding domain-containing protein [Bradyrhizobium sp. Arg237L]MDI4235472.1 saccharopine dehydrogenase NADP-binding domain-containing protein [Bradyrhizobium sp. Arg237L]
MRVAVYGANGFQGKLTTAMLMQNGIQAVLVGRNQERLTAAAGELEMSAVELRVAEATDRRALLRAFEGCGAVINCAGPFTRRAEPIVSAAIAAGYHYVDTAGEQGFVKSVFDNFSGEAQKAGVTVLPSATDGAVPGDLVAHMIARRAGQIDSIIVAHKIVGGGGPSKGSLRSVVETCGDIAAGGLTYEDGAWRNGEPLDRSTIAFLGDEEVGHIEVSPDRGGYNTEACLGASCRRGDRNIHRDATICSFLGANDRSRLKPVAGRPEGSNIFDRLRGHVDRWRRTQRDGGRYRRLWNHCRHCR